MQSKSLRNSIFTQAVLAVYFQAIQWLPLGRWNYQPGFDPLLTGALQGHLVVLDVLIMMLFVLPALLFWIAYRRGLIWLMWACLVGYTIWLGMEVKTWWVSYILGASDQWVEVYQRVFSQSTKVLPSFGRHLAPDGMHFVLQLLLAVIVITGAVGLLQRRGNAAR